MKESIIILLLSYGAIAAVFFATGVLKFRTAKRNLDREMATISTRDRGQLVERMYQAATMASLSLLWPMMTKRSVAPRYTKRRALAGSKEKEAGDRALLGHAHSARIYGDKSALVTWEQVAGDIEEWVKYDIGRDYRKETS